MTEGQSSTAESKAGEDEEEVDFNALDEDDTDEVDDELDLPDGIIIPDLHMQIRVENACRKVCSFSVAQEAREERILRQKVMTKTALAAWTFMFPDNNHHAFYKWRLAENRAGRGIETEEDMA